VIIAVTSLKGGVGKTTTGILLSMCAAEEARPVTLLDGDNELSALSWATVARNLPFNVVRADIDGLVRQARELDDAGHTVVIDTPPNAKDVMLSAALAAHVVIVPVAPTNIDLNRLTRTTKALLDVVSARPDLVIQILITRYSRGTRLARVTADALSGFPVLPHQIRDLERYKSMGGTVPTYLAEYREVWMALKKLAVENG
jgi:chromosome partitioning protein